MSDPTILASTLFVNLKKNLLNAKKNKVIAEKGRDIILVLSTLAEAVIVSNGISLKEKLESIDNLNIELIEALSDVYGAVIHANDEKKAEECIKRLLKAYSFSKEPVKKGDIIKKVIGM